MRVCWLVSMAVLSAAAPGSAGEVDLLATARVVQVLPIGPGCGFQEVTSDPGLFEVSDSTTCPQDCDQSVNAVFESSFVGEDYVVEDSLASIDGSDCAKAGGAISNVMQASGSAVYELATARLYSLGGMITRSATGGGLALAIVELRDLDDRVIHQFESTESFLIVDALPAGTYEIRWGWLITAQLDQHASASVQFGFQLSTGCPWDCDGSGDDNVNVLDVLALLAQFDLTAPANCTGPDPCDFNADGCTDVVDLLKLLTHYTTDPSGAGCPL